MSAGPRGHILFVRNWFVAGLIFVAVLLHGFTVTVSYLAPVPQLLLFALLAFALFPLARRVRRSMVGERFFAFLGFLLLVASLFVVNGFPDRYENFENLTRLDEWSIGGSTIVAAYQKYFSACESEILLTEGESFTVRGSCATFPTRTNFGTEKGIIAAVLPLAYLVGVVVLWRRTGTNRT